MSWGRGKRDESPIRSLRFQSGLGSEYLLSQLESRTRYFASVKEAQLSPAQSPALDARMTFHSSPTSSQKISVTFNESTLPRPHRTRSLGAPSQILHKLDDPPQLNLQQSKPRKGWRRRISRLGRFLRHERRDESIDSFTESVNVNVERKDDWIHRTQSVPDNYSHRLFNNDEGLAEVEAAIEEKWRGKLEKWAGSLEEAMAVVGREGQLRDEISGLERERKQLLTRLQQVASEREQWIARCTYLESELRHKTLQLDRSYRRTRSMESKKELSVRNKAWKEVEVLASPAAILCPEDPKTPPLWNPSSKARMRPPIRLELSQLLAQMQDLESQVQFLKRRRESLSLVNPASL